ncbi:WXG100-like domain-containing protein [Nocardiopsis flavescens]
MGMEIPDELANLFYGLTGTKWPDVDEDRLRDVSDMYSTVEYILATELPELIVVLRRKVQSTFDGRTTEYFENSLAQFTAGQRDYVGEAAQLAADIQKYAKESANQVEYAKWMIIGQLIQLALEIAWAIATAKFTFGASLAWISMFRFIRSQAIRRILNWLVWNLLSHLFVAQLFGVTMDLLIQRIQMDQGNRDEWDKELTRMAAAGAFVEGLLSAGLSFGADLFLNKQLAKLFGDNLPDPVVPPPVRDIVPEPPPGPVGRGPEPTPDPPPLRDIPETLPTPTPRTPDPGPLDPPPVREGAPDPPGPPNGPPGPPPGGGPPPPAPRPPGSITPEFDKDLVTLFARNSNEFLSPAQRPNTASRGIGHGERFIDGAGDVFARHFRDELGEGAARQLGRDYAETLLRNWNTPRATSALDDVLGGAPLPQSTRDHLARDVPRAFADTVAEFGNRWRDRLTALGIGAGSGAFEGYMGEGLTNLIFSPEQEWKASGMSAVAGAATSVVHDLSVAGGLKAIDSLSDLHALNNTPVDLPDPDGSGTRGPVPDGGGDGRDQPFAPGQGNGGGFGGNGFGGNGFGNEEGPVLRLRGGGGDDMSFDLGSEFGSEFRSEYGDDDGDDVSTIAPSEEWSALDGRRSEDGEGGRGRPGEEAAAGPRERTESNGERSGPPAQAGGERNVPRTESSGGSESGGRFTPPPAPAESGGQNDTRSGGGDRTGGSGNVGRNGENPLAPPSAEQNNGLTGGDERTDETGDEAGSPLPPPPAEQGEQDTTVTERTGETGDEAETPAPVPPAEQNTGGDEHTNETGEDNENPLAPPPPAEQGGQGGQNTVPTGEDGGAETTLTPPGGEGEQNTTVTERTGETGDETETPLPVPPAEQDTGGDERTNETGRDDGTRLPPLPAGEEGRNTTDDQNVVRERTVTEGETGVTVAPTVPRNGEEGLDGSTGDGRRTVAEDGFLGVEEVAEHGPAVSETPMHQVAPPAVQSPPAGEAQGSRDTSAHRGGGRGPLPGGRTEQPSPRAEDGGAENGVRSGAAREDGVFRTGQGDPEVHESGGLTPLPPGEGGSGPPERRGGETDLDAFFRSLTPPVESTSSDGTVRPATVPGDEGRPPRLESTSDAEKTDDGLTPEDPGPPPPPPPAPPREEDADKRTPAPTDKDARKPSDERRGREDRDRRPPKEPVTEETLTPAPPPGEEGGEETVTDPLAPPPPPAEETGGEFRDPRTTPSEEVRTGRTESLPPPPPGEEGGEETVTDPLAPPPPPAEETPEKTPEKKAATPPPPVEEESSEDPLAPPPGEETVGKTSEVPPPPPEEKAPEEKAPEKKAAEETGTEGTETPPPPPEEKAPKEETPRRKAPEEPPPPGEEGSRSTPPPPPPPPGEEAVTPLPPPPDPLSGPPEPEGAPGPVRLNYLIDSRWIESYGVRVDPDAVLDTRADLPADVRAPLRRKLESDPRDFFSRDGVTATSADGTAYTLRLRSTDDWHAGGRDRGGAEKAKYKGLHDTQTQSSRGESGMVGSARRPVVAFQANLLGVDGLPAPAAGFRASAFGGSAVQQQSGDTGHTQTLTTEMTGEGTAYTTELTAEWSPDRPPPPPAADTPRARAEGVDLGPTPSRAPVEGGVELVLMGGLRRRDDLPERITFTDPFLPPPAAEATTGEEGTGTGGGPPDRTGDPVRDEEAPRRYGGYLANSHPISIDAITRRVETPDSGTDTGSDTGSERTAPDRGAPREGRSRWRDLLTPWKPRDRDPAETPTGLNSWISDRLGFEAPGEGSNTRTVLHRPRPGSGEPKVATHPKSGSRAVRREMDRRGVLEVFADDIVMTQLPTMTDEPRTVRIPDAEGGTRLLTIWAPPTSMELVPEAPKDFNMKFTDRYARGASVLANRLKGFFVAVSGGVVTRVPGDAVRVDAPYFEARFQRVWAKGRGRSDNSWDAHLFHSTDTAVYRTRRTIAVWLDGDAEPTYFDASGLEAVTADDVRRLDGDPPETAEVERTGDPFLDREGGPTHFGDALVRDVTHEDGSEMREEDGGLPQSFFRDFAHQVLTQIDRDYPGLVLPHLAVPGTPAPENPHAGWNHRRNRRTAELNTETVLARINSSDFRADRDAWLSGQVEIKLVETKFLPFGNEVRERRFTVPDHISVWPRVEVLGYSEAADPLDTSHTGSTTGSSSNINRKSDKITSVTAEGRTGVTLRGVSSGVDSFGAPNQGGGVHFRAANEFRTRKQSEYGVSATAETNVKDKSGSRVLFADLRFSAWMGPDDSLVPRSARWDAPSRTGMGRELFGDGEGLPDPPRARAELHTPRNGRRFALDAPPEQPPAPPRKLPSSQAKRLFDNGASAFLPENLPLRTPPSSPPARLETITEVAEDAETAVEGAPPPEGTTEGTPPPEGTEGAPPVGRTTDTAVGRDTRTPEPELRIEPTDRARRLSQTFSSVQAFNPALLRRDSGVVTVTTLTYSGLDRDHWAFSRAASSREGAAAIIAGNTSPQALAASPGLQRDGGSRFRVQLDDGIAPWRTRPTTATWYIPTHVASALLREFAVMEPNQVKEISYGFGTSRESVFSTALTARGVFSSQPTAATPEQAPRGSAGPIVQPGVELRYIPYGHGRGESSSVTFRTRREVKFTGSTFEFVTHGVILQATEHKKDFDFLFSVPRSPGAGDYSAWTAQVRDAQKTMVPALWVFAQGLVDDQLTWGPDGRVTKGAHPPPQGPHRRLELKPDLHGKGYDTRPVHVPGLISQLEQRLRRGGWELTTHSREDLVQTVTSHLNRGMANLSGVEVRVVPTDTRWESSEWTPRIKDRSRVATLDLGLFPMPSTVEQIGGRMEFVDRNVKVTSESESESSFRGYGAGGGVDLLGPIGNREDPATGRQVGAISAGGTPGYRRQKLVEDASAENRAREETQERVVFTPYAVVTTPTRVDASLRIGDQVFNASVVDGEAQSVHPLPYLETLGRGADTEPPGTRYRPASFTRTDEGSYEDDWAAVNRGRDGRGFQDGEAGIENVPLAIEKDGREVLDAAVVNAALLDGWERTGGPGRLDAAEVQDAARHLDRKITDIERAAGITARKQEMLLLSLTPDATEDAVTIAEFGDTVVRTRALVDTDRAVIEGVSGESRARDSDQEGTRRSQNTSESRAQNAGLGGQVTETARPADRLRENLDADNAALSGAKDGVSSGQREGAVAEGPGTKRMFLVRVPARWLVWAEDSGGDSGPVGSQTDSSVVRWIDEDRARAWGLDTDAPVITRYSEAEAAFTKADAAYLKARGELFEFVNEVDTDNAGDTTRLDYRERDGRYRELEEARNRAMRDMVDAMRDLREHNARRAAPVVAGTEGARVAPVEGAPPAPAETTGLTPPAVITEEGEGSRGPVGETSVEKAPGEEPAAPRDIRPPKTVRFRFPDSDAESDTEAEPRGPVFGEGREYGEYGFHGLRGVDSDDDFFVFDRGRPAPAPRAEHLMTPAVRTENPVPSQDEEVDLYNATPPGTPRVAPVRAPLPTLPPPAPASTESGPVRERTGTEASAGDGFTPLDPEPPVTGTEGDTGAEESGEGEVPAPPAPKPVVTTTEEGVEATTPTEETPPPPAPERTVTTTEEDAETATPVEEETPAPPAPVVTATEEDTGVETPTPLTSEHTVTVTEEDAGAEESGEGEVPAPPAPKPTVPVTEEGGGTGGEGSRLPAPPPDPPTRRTEEPAPEDTAVRSRTEDGTEPAEEPAPPAPREHGLGRRGSDGVLRFPSEADIVPYGDLLHDPGFNGNTYDSQPRATQRYVDVYTADGWIAEFSRLPNLDEATVQAELDRLREKSRTSPGWLLYEINNGRWPVLSSLPHLLDGGSLTPEQAEVVRSVVESRYPEAALENLRHDAGPAGRIAETLPDKRGRGSYPDAREVLDIIDRLDRATDPSLPEGVEAVRGVFGFDHLAPGGTEDPASLVGRTFTAPGFTSVSLGTRPSASGGAPTDIIRLSLPPGTRGLWVGDRSLHPGEREIILARGTALRVLSFERWGRGWALHAEVVPEGAAPPPTETAQEAPGSEEGVFTGLPPVEDTVHGGEGGPVEPPPGPPAVPHTPAAEETEPAAGGGNVPPTRQEELNSLFSDALSPSSGS